MKLLVAHTTPGTNPPHNIASTGEISVTVSKMETLEDAERFARVTFDAVIWVGPFPSKHVSEYIAARVRSTMKPLRKDTIPAEWTDDLTEADHYELANILSNGFSGPHPEWNKKYIIGWINEQAGYYNLIRRLCLRLLLRK